MKAPSAFKTAGTVDLGGNLQKCLWYHEGFCVEYVKSRVFHVAVGLKLSEENLQTSTMSKLSQGQVCVNLTLKWVNSELPVSPVFSVRGDVSACGFT